ncbi:MAG: hypothetical protein ACK5ZV_12475 [bacterium]
MKPTTPSRSTPTGANPHTRANLSTRATRHTRANLSTRPGLTIREVLAATAVTGAALCLALPLLAQVRSDDRQQRDAVQLRGLLDAFTIWAGNNKEAFPLPSSLDPNNSTSNISLPWVKNITGNIVSVLIWNGLVRPDALVSPAENNSAVSVDLGYQFAQPSRANRPAESLWDPGFSGAVGPVQGAIPRNSGTIAHQSYVHGTPFGSRADTAVWGTAGASTRAVWANRGPTYVTGTSSTPDAGTRPAAGWQPLPVSQSLRSNTLAFYGAADTWEGNVAYIDGSVDFVTQPDPAKNTYRPLVSGTLGPAQNDNIFVDESDEVAGGVSAAFMNNRHVYLRSYSGVSGTNTAQRIIPWRD